jgi:hypothetical protein
MGSFNTSCAVSQLPIGEKDEVVILLAVAAPGIDRTKILYNDHFHKLIGLPMTGYYNDYGKYKLEETTRNREIWEIYNRFLCANLNKEDFLLEEDMDKPESWTFTFDDVQDIIWNDGINIQYTGYDNEVYELPISIYAVHKHIYETLSSEFTYYAGTFSTNEHVEKIRSHPHYDYFINHETFIPEYESKVIAENLEEETLEEKVWAEINMALMLAEFKRPPLPFYENVHIERSGVQRKFDFKMTDYLVYAEEIIGLSVFETNLRQLNIQVVPSISGGQAFNYNTHIAFHKSVADLAEKYRDDKERDY